MGPGARLARAARVPDRPRPRRRRRQRPAPRSRAACAAVTACDPHGCPTPRRSERRWTLIDLSVSRGRSSDSTATSGAATQAAPDGSGGSRTPGFAVSPRAWCNACRSSSDSSAPAPGTAIPRNPRAARSGRPSPALRRRVCSRCGGGVSADRAAGTRAQPPHPHITTISVRRAAAIRCLLKRPAEFDGDRPGDHDASLARTQCGD